MAGKVNLCDTTLLLTRPASASARFARQAEMQLGRFAQIVTSPLLRIMPLDVAVPATPETGFAFTSENGVAAIADKTGPPGRRAWCVGPHTAERARAAGFDVITAGGNVEQLAQKILADRPAETIVHICGQNRQGDLVEQLDAAGIPAKTLIAYDQVTQALSAETIAVLATDRDIVAPVFSPRSARLLRAAVRERVARLHVVAISANALGPWGPRPGERFEISGSADGAGVVSAMGRLFDADQDA